MRLVLKLGSSTVTRDGTLDAPRLIDYARAIAALRAQGHQIVLVSSGAVAAGRATMRTHSGDPVVVGKQMLAAIGQPRLMALYGELFGHYGLTVAQVLLTRADLDDRRRYLNARNTFEAMLAAGVLPVVNENDTVATEEIRVGDNDQLSALVSSLVDARLLVLMTDQTGLFDANPRTHPEARLIERVDDAEIPDAIWAAAGGSAGALGTGGMRTKLTAAEIARRNGADVVIADGRAPGAARRHRARRGHRHPLQRQHACARRPQPLHPRRPALMASACASMPARWMRCAPARACSASVCAASTESSIAAIRWRCTMATGA
jgi:glutamate 5-kinase